MIKLSRRNKNTDDDHSNFNSNFKIEESIRLIIESLDEVGDDSDIISSFNQSFKSVSTIQTKDQLASAIMMSQEIRDWYLRFCESRRTSLEKPEWLPSDQEGLDDWIEMQSKLESYQKRLNEWNRGLLNGISDLQKRITGIQNEKIKYFKNAHPLIIIHSLSVQDLRTAQILELVTISDLELRKEKQERYLNELKANFYDQWKKDAFDNPYLDF